MTERDPIAQYFTHPRQDRVASLGTIWPRAVARAQGFVLFCGLFYLRSCTATRALLDAMLDDVAESGDDQVSLNRVLQRRGMQWASAKVHSYPLLHDGQQFLCYKDTITGRSADGELNVALLPHHVFQRLHMPAQNAFVMHLLCDKSSASKLDMFEQSNSRFLRADWRQVDFTERTLETLDSQPHKPTKILVYGLQSSGASLFTYFLSQKPHTLGIVDLNNHRVCPQLQSEHDIAFKAVITTKWSLQDHLDSFRPDRTILFIRNPYNNYYSLMRKAYADKSGTIDDKFRQLETLFCNRAQFDLTLFYEDFIADANETVRKPNSIGWPTAFPYRRVRSYNSISHTAPGVATTPQRKGPPEAGGRATHAPLR